MPEQQQPLAPQHPLSSPDVSERVVGTCPCPGLRLVGHPSTWRTRLREGIDIPAEGF